MALFGRKDKKSPADQNTAKSAKIRDEELNLKTNQVAEGITEILDLISPSALEVDFDYVKIGNGYFRTIFVSGYPRFVGANWLSPLINFDHTLDISMFYYPVASHGILDNLKRKIAEMEATMNADREQGKVTDPVVKAALEDALALQEQLVKGVERFFQFSFYITIPASSLEELNTVTKRVEAVLGSLLLFSKHATLQMEDAFASTIPLCLDKLYIIRNMDTTSLATTFPFTSSELTANEGTLYGINEHNGSLIIFDRFSLENANMVIFAKSGAGKSYMVKLEALRSLMFGAEIIVIDPESEYQKLTQAIGGEYITFSPNSPSKINPFDLSGVYEEGENELGLKILSLHTLLKIIFKNISATQEAVLDRALVATYKLKGITADPGTQKNEPPIMEDLYKVLLAMEDTDAKTLADMLERYIKGSLVGIFDQRSNINIRNTFTVFSIRDLEDQLRPIAMYIILDYIWTKIRREIKRRILVVDEAWYLMQYPESATFIYSIAKRARKYYLGLSTITQDVEDFLSSDYGKAIVTNSSLQVLFKQSPAAIDKLGEVFYLSDGEKKFLLSCNVGEGLFFAGTNHVAMQVVASPSEHKLITTSPKEILASLNKDGARPNPATQVPANPVPNINPTQPPFPVEASGGSPPPEPHTN
ncbi:MAG: ATP-binding protein [Patescibacteria group bacterium]|nr:ATP-binding protein [Patescibacteria group bacterium]